MKKSHRVDVVRELDSRGFFTIREAADFVAKRLKVVRVQPVPIMVTAT